MCRQPIRELWNNLPKTAPPVFKVSDLIKLVSALQSGSLGSVKVVPINIPGKIVLVTEELFRSLDAQEALALACPTNTPLSRS